MLICVLRMMYIDSPVEINKDEIEMIEKDFTRAYWPWELPNALREKMKDVCIVIKVFSTFHFVATAFHFVLCMYVRSYSRYSYCFVHLCRVTLYCFKAQRDIQKKQLTKSCMKKI